MNEQDLRDCFAMFAMVGLLFNENYEAGCLANMSYHIANKMLEQRTKEPKEPEAEEGIVAVKPKRRSK
jgi:hypothetical protein